MADLLSKLTNLRFPSFQAGGVKSAAKPESKYGAAPVQRHDAYSQYDNKLEHGYDGEQYRNGKLVGQKLNFEW